MTTHASLTGSDLHESKGTAGASAGAIFVADGAGSGSYTTTPTISGYTKTANQFNLNICYITCYNPDVGTAGASTFFVVMPRAGTITKIYCTTQKAAGGSNNTLTSSIAGVNVTNGVVTITSAGAAAGDVSSATPTAANTVTAGQALKFTSNNGSTTVTPVVLTIELTASA